jgi:hypothetical protein
VLEYDNDDTPTGDWLAAVVVPVVQPPPPSGGVPRRSVVVQARRAATTRSRAHAASFYLNLSFGHEISLTSDS